MYKKIIVLLLLVLMGCGGGGGADEYQPPALTQEQEDAITGALVNINNDLQDDLRKIEDAKAGSHTNYVGFTVNDFSGKTVYFVETDAYIKAEFEAGNGVVRIYDSNQGVLYQKGTWIMYYGELVITLASAPTKMTTYTLISDDEADRYFKASRELSDRTTHTIGIFYDQTTGESQAKDFVAEHRIP